jgi:hypothetical protein
LFSFLGIPDHDVVQGNPNSPCEKKWAISVRQTFLPQLTESIESINKERPAFVIAIFVVQQ